MCFTMRSLIVLFVFLNTGFVAGSSCYSDDGDCAVSATYYASTDTTYWAAACEDGSVFNGAVGGNEVDSLCLE